MEGRELTFADPKIQKFLKTHFVAVADNDWYLRRRRDAEGIFFRRMADQGPLRGRPNANRQGLYVLTPSGRLLAYRNHQDPALIYAFLRQGYFSWRRLPIEERQPGAIVVGDPGRPDKTFHREPPPGGLVIHVYTRILERAAKGNYRPGTCSVPGGQRSAHDNLWLTEAEWKSLLPANARAGKSFPVPERLALRIARFHLVDNTRGEPPFWERRQVRQGGLKLTVEEVDNRGMELRLQGSYLLTTAANPARSQRGYDVSLLGYLRYDAVKKKLDRFDVLAVGDHWGDGPVNNGSARPGRQPLGFAFELRTGDLPADRLLPEAARDFREYMEAEK